MANPLAKFSFLRQEAFEVYSLHLACMEVEDCFTPKHHMMFHLLRRCDRLGNPRLHAAWLSEAKNKTLKMACRTTNQASCECSILFRMRELLQKWERQGN